MADPVNKLAQSVATIDVELVIARIASRNWAIAIETASKIGVEPAIETADGIKLMIRNRLRAQKLPKNTVTGNTITMTDNVFVPELVQVLQGGTIIYDTVDTNKVIGYLPPVAGSKDEGEVFELVSYSAVYDASGQIEKYEEMIYPNCQGTPISMSSESDVFRVSEYIINSAPKLGEPPYQLNYVDTLPVVVTE